MGWANQSKIYSCALYVSQDAGLTWFLDKQYGLLVNNVIKNCEKYLPGLRTKVNSAERAQKAVVPCYDLVTMLEQMKAIEIAEAATACMELQLIELDITCEKTIAIQIVRHKQIHLSVLTNSLMNKDAIFLATFASVPIVNMFMKIIVKELNDLISKVDEQNVALLKKLTIQTFEEATCTIMNVNHFIGN